MRITFLSPVVNMGGGTRVLAIHAQRLAARGHDVTVVSTPRPPWRLREFLRNARKGTWRRPPLSSHFASMGLNHTCINRSRPIVDGDVPDADVVVATWWETAEWGAALSARKGKKAYFVQGHETFPGLPIERCRATYRLPLRKIVVSQWLADIMADEYGDRDVHLVLNGVDHEQFCAPPRGRGVVPTVGFIYSDNEVKGGDTLLRVIDELAKRNAKLRLLSFSTQPWREATERGVEFHHNPPQHRLAELYAQCDVWLSTSRSEGFGLPVLEAMACRTPVVATRTGWPKHGIAEGVTGHTTEVDDVEGLVAAVETVLAMPDSQWRQMSTAAYRCACEHTWERACQRFERALEEIVAS